MQTALHPILCAAALAICAAASAEPEGGSARPGDRFVQDEFCISFWVHPGLGENFAARYAEMAEANFTAILDTGVGTVETMPEQLALCEKLGMKAIISHAHIQNDALAGSPALWGYYLRDEPNAAAFPELAELVAGVRSRRPGKLAYINLYPNYANAQQLGTETYDEHVRRFVNEVDVDVLSMDHYPALRPDGDTRSSYCSNLEYMRVYSLSKDIPFWNFFNVMPFGPHDDPTEAGLRWQVFASLTYGAKGVLYFCYWTPRGGEFPKGGAIITAEGRKTRHYDQARRINARVKALGPTLMQLRSTGVSHIPAGEAPAPFLEGSPIASITRNDYGPYGSYLIGTFEHGDGRRAVMYTNYSYTHTTWTTVEFDADHDAVREVCQTTGEEIPLVDESPAMEGLQISLDAGEGRLFLLP